jgi:hypothetical protein
MPPIFENCFANDTISSWKVTWIRRIPSSGMLRRVVLVRTDGSEECIAFIIRVTRIGELGTLAVTGNRRMLRSNLRSLVTVNVVSNSPIHVTLMMEAIRCSETSVLTTATRCNIPDDGIFHSHCRENLKSYTALTDWNLYQRRECLLWGTNWFLISQKTAFFTVTAVEISNLT